LKGARRSGDWRKGPEGRGRKSERKSFGGHLSPFSPEKNLYRKLRERDCRMRRGGRKYKEKENYEGGSWRLSPFSIKENKKLSRQLRCWDE